MLGDKHVTESMWLLDTSFNKRVESHCVNVSAADTNVLPLVCASAYLTT